MFVYIWFYYLLRIIYTDDVSCFHYFYSSSDMLLLSCYFLFCQLFPGGGFSEVYLSFN